MLKIVEVVGLRAPLNFIENSNFKFDLASNMDLRQQIGIHWKELNTGENADVTTEVSIYLLFSNPLIACLLKNQCILAGMMQWKQTSIF